MDLYSSIFAPNNLLATKIKKIRRDTWRKIELQFRIYLNLDSLIFASNNSLGTQIQKLDETRGAKLDSTLEFN